MSPRGRVASAWRLVLIGVGIRLALGLGAGVVPASWASEATRHHPRGELALVDSGALLLFDVLAHGALPQGAGRLSLFFAVVAMGVGLVPFGALVLFLREPAPTMRLLGQSLSRLGTSLLASGIALVVLALVVVLEVMAFGPLITAFSRKSLTIPILLLALALPAPAAVGLLGDVLRVRSLLTDDGLVKRCEQTLRTVRRGAARLFARYLFAAGLQALAIAGALALALGVIAQSAPVLALGLAGSSALLVLAAFARAWLVSHVVAAVAPLEASDPGDAHADRVEALHGPEDVGYEAASTREPR